MVALFDSQGNKKSLTKYADGSFSEIIIDSEGTKHVITTHSNGTVDIDGNTEEIVPQTQLPVKKKVVAKRYRRWAFTLNNFTEEEKIRLDIVLRIDFTYGCYGEEGSQPGKTPHLQGYLIYKESIGIKALKKKLNLERIHLENARENTQCNIDYCKKEGGYFWESCPPPMLANPNDRMASIVKSAMDGTPEKDMIDLYGGSYMRYRKEITESVRRIQFEDAKEKLTENFNRQHLRDWQKELMTKLDQDPHPRQILWHTDTIGGAGKTWMSKYLVANNDAFLTSNGQSADLKYAYAGQRIICFDFSRSMQEQINYGIIETLKNGCYLNTKYESAMRIYKIPHLIVFANFEPDMTKLSEDRWAIKTLTEADTVPVENELNVDISLSAVDVHTNDVLDHNAEEAFITEIENLKMQLREKDDRIAHMEGVIHGTNSSIDKLDVQLLIQKNHIRKLEEIERLVKLNNIDLSEKFKSDSQKPGCSKFQPLNIESECSTLNIESECSTTELDSESERLVIDSQDNDSNPSESLSILSCVTLKSTQELRDDSAEMWMDNKLWEDNPIEWEMQQQEKRERRESLKDSITLDRYKCMLDESQNMLDSTCIFSDDEEDSTDYWLKVHNYTPVKLTPKPKKRKREPTKKVDESESKVLITNYFSRVSNNKLTLKKR